MAESSRNEAALSPRPPIWVSALRWIAVIPVAIGAAVLVLWVARVFFALGGRLQVPLTSAEESVGWAAFLASFIPNGFAAFAFVLAAGMVAPRFTRIVGTSSAVTICVLAVLQAVGSISLAGWSVVLPALSAVVGATIGAVMSWDEAASV